MLWFFLIYAAIGVLMSFKHVMWSVVLIIVWPAYLIVMTLAQDPEMRIAMTRWSNRNK